MSFNYIIAMLLVTLGVYCLLLKRNLIKLIIGLAVLTDGIHLFLISLGYRARGIAAIVSGEWFSDLPGFATRAVDPVPQALVLTSIVINICILALALSLCIYAYRHYGTLDPSKLRRLRE
ncbi:MAG: NADH-quinone oxidoreductase subunit K [Hadesarchaea archaeon]|nr:NADH-quinone oxidoreductase subunit K [Hadesarchaea archaeon]